MSIADEQARRAPLNLPVVASALYSKNFIKQAVCELRFPTLYDLDAHKPPGGFAKALRKEYPNQQTVKSVNLALGEDAATAAFHHTFKSRGSKWAISLRSSAVVLETKDYTSYEEFRRRLSDLVREAAAIIDSDFYTRIGLRYINAVPYDKNSIGEWINPSLVEVLSSGVLGEPMEYAGRVQGVTDVGGYIIQHGILSGPSRNIGALSIGANTEIESTNSPQIEYSIDFDLFAEDVQADEAISTVDRLHQLEHSLFDWALGPLARSHLGPSILGASS